MSVLILISLGTIIALTVFSVVAGSNWSSLSSEGFSGGIGLFGSEYAFQLDNLTGAIVVLVIIISISALIGIRVLDTGLSDSSIRIITISISYAGLWALFSVFAMPLILQIQVFGSILYIFLTILFTIGVIQKISGGNND